MSGVVETLRALLIYELNGALALLFAAYERGWGLAAAALWAPLLRGAPREQRPFLLAAALLGTAAALLAPPPIPALIVLMTGAAAAATALDRFEPDATRWRAAGGLLLYALAALGYQAYRRYLLGLEAHEWARALGGQGEAQAALAQGRGFLETVGVWGLYVILPLGFLSLLVQGILSHPPLPAPPEEILRRVRERGPGRGAGGAVGP